MQKWVQTLVATVALWSSAGIAEASLKIGVAAEPYPPFATKDASDTWVGWEIDFIHALCAEMKEDCEIVDMAWDGIIPALQENKIDAIASSMAITEKRKTVIAFSRFYYNTSISVIALKDVTGGLRGKAIGAQGATVSAAYAEKHYEGSTFKTYRTLDDATADLAAGRVEAVIGETNALAAFLKTAGGAGCCVSIGEVEPDPAILGEGVGVGLRQADIQLKARIDAAIGALATSGKLKAITAAYPELVIGLTLPH